MLCSHPVSPDGDVLHVVARFSAMKLNLQCPPPADRTATPCRR